MKKEAIYDIAHCYQNGDLENALMEAAAWVKELGVEEMQAAQPAPGFAQPSMFPEGQDTPLFTLPEDAAPVIELMYLEMSPRAVDVALDCIAYAWPKSVAGCWARLDRVLAAEEMSQELYDEIKTNCDFIIAD